MTQLCIPKGRKANVWQYFKLVESEQETKIFYNAFCNMCKESTVYIKDNTRSEPTNDRGYANIYQQEPYFAVI